MNAFVRSHGSRPIILPIIKHDEVITNLPTDGTVECDTLSVVPYHDRHRTCEPYRRDPERDKCPPGDTELMSKCSYEDKGHSACKFNGEAR